MKIVADFLGRYPFFLLLLPAFVVIHFEKEFSGMVRYAFLLDRILILFAVSGLSFLVFYLFIRPVKKTSLMTLGFLVFFYYAGELKNWLSAEIPGSVLQRYSFLLSVSAVILLGLFILLKKSKSSLHRLYLYINTALFIFILADAFIIFTGSINSKYKIVSEKETEDMPCNDCIKPDIYYLLIDAYTSSQYLLSEYGYSNQATEEDLKNKGFIIIPYSKSNYNYTAYSLASVFNMNYIENVDTVNKTTDREYLQAVKLVQKSRVFSFFQKENYRIFNHSIFDFSGFPGTIKHIDFWGIRESFDQYNLVLKLFQDVGYLLPRWSESILAKNPYYVNSLQNRARLSHTRDRQLWETIKLECNQPKFVYAHYLRPHPPYYFDSTGQAFTDNDVTMQEAYLHQIAFSNERLKKTTDSIIFYARRPLVIIVQGDHGISFSEPRKPQHYFPNFQAIYFSNKDYKLFTDSTHNVNTFRILLNTYFKKNMELLPYRSYFIRS
jgi:hypothetical protein